MSDETLVALATRHHAALDGLTALTAAAVEGLTAAERESHAGRLFYGLAALVDQQREQAAALLTLAEDAADAAPDHQFQRRTVKSEDAEARSY